jgi:hypothetical protein
VPQQLDDSLWTATVGNGIAYTELVRDGSPTFSIENDGSTLRRTVLVLWDELDYAKDAFLGYPQVLGSGGMQQWIARNVPDAAYIFLNTSGNPYLFATKLSGSGYGMPGDASEGIHDPDTDFPVYRYAKLEVSYETLTYDILSDEQMVVAGLVYPTGDTGQPDEATLARYVTIEPNPGAEYLTLPQGGFSFVGPTIPGTPPTPAPVPGGPGKIVPNYDLSITWHLVPRAAVGSVLLNPALQNPSIDLCLGNVNSNTFPANPNANIYAAQSAVTTIPGAGYSVNQQLTLSGLGALMPAKVRVLSVTDGGGLNQVALVSRGAYPASVGQINAIDVPGGGQLELTFGAGFPVGSLLMTGATIKPVRSTSGDRLYDLTYRFKFLQQGIQFLYYQGTQANAYNDAGYFEVTTNGTTNLELQNNSPWLGPVNIYPWCDFNQLFRVPS